MGAVVCDGENDTVGTRFGLVPGCVVGKEVFDVVVGDGDNDTVVTGARVGVVSAELLLLLFVPRVSTKVTETAVTITTKIMAIKTRM